MTGTSELRGYFYSGNRYYSVKSSAGSKTSSAGAPVEDYDVTELTIEELENLIASCGVSSSSAHHTARSFLLQESPPTSNMQNRVLEIATDADFEYFSAEGGGASANASILAILNALDAIYEAQLMLSITVTFQNAWNTASDPYSSSDAGTLLDQFTNYWRSNFSGSVNYDVAHLWTGAI